MVVTSAGNSGTDLKDYSPAQHDECITVTAMDAVNNNVPSFRYKVLDCMFCSFH
jgi:hypothetical protein